MTPTSTNIIQNETRKQQVDKCRSSGTHRAASNTPNQGNELKYGGTGLHQDQDAPKSSISYIRDLQVEGSDVQRWQTRIVNSDNEGLQERY